METVGVEHTEIIRASIKDTAIKNTALEILAQVLQISEEDVNYISQITPLLSQDERVEKVCYASNIESLKGLSIYVYLRQELNNKEDTLSFLNQFNGQFQNARIWKSRNIETGYCMRVENLLFCFYNPEKKN